MPWDANVFEERTILAGGSNCHFAGRCPAGESGMLPSSVYWVHPSDGRLYVYHVGASTEEVRKLSEVFFLHHDMPTWRHCTVPLSNNVISKII